MPKMTSIMVVTSLNTGVAAMRCRRRNGSGMARPFMVKGTSLSFGMFAKGPCSFDIEADGDDAGGSSSGLCPPSTTRMRWVERNHRSEAGCEGGREGVK